MLPSMAQCGCCTVGRKVFFVRLAPSVHAVSVCVSKGGVSLSQQTPVVTAKAFSPQS